MTRVRLGISTCPNDTFAFHALLTRAVDWRGLDFEVELADIEELNQRLAAGTLDVAKASFGAALLLGSLVLVLPSGAALGFGVGPLLLAAPGRGAAPYSGRPRVLAPGEHTTAALLWRLFHAEHGTLEHVLFSTILPALAAGRADLGLCIHEARFTWRSCGVELVEDLGARWERETGAPLPLGGILGRRELGSGVLHRVQAVIEDSLAFGHAHRAECLPTMRRYAQELDEHVLWSHVELYVNEWTRDLGTTGKTALATLAELARVRGLVPANTSALEVL